MKKYMVYLDDNDKCYKIAVPADNEQAARAYVAGSGEVVAVKDVTGDYPINITKVVSALVAAKFGATEIDYIMRCLLINDIADWNTDLPSND